MATVTKDFRVKSGLVVEGTNGTINGSDIITAASLAGTENGISVSYDAGTKTVTFDVNDPTITISGDVDGSATMTDLGNTEIAVTLDTVNANVGTFGSGTEIPSVTVDAKGRVTAVTTNSVATDLSIAGNSGTDTVSLLSDTLTFTGGDGISTVVSNNDVLITPNVGNGLTLDGANIAIDTNTTVDLATAQTLSNKTLGTDLAAGGFTISGLAEPVNAQDAATKFYVDSAVSGLNWKEAVNLLADSNVDLSGTSGTLVIDGHAALDTNDNGVYRLLLIGQTVDSENGIYDYFDDGNAYTLTRSADADTYQELDGAAVFVQEGTLYGATSWVQTDHYMTDFSGQVWSQFSGQGTYLAGNGLTLTGNTFSIDDTVVVTETDLNTAVTNLTNYVDGFLDPSTGTTVEYIDQQDQTTLVAANQYTNTLVASGDATATPTYEAIDINSISKQVAYSTIVEPATSLVPVFNKTEFRSGKFLVKLAVGTHTEVSEVLLTLDTSDNIAITEYAVVGTNGSMSTIGAVIIGDDVYLDIVPTTTGSTATIMGTLLV